MPEARPADPLSIVALASGIASLVLSLFAVLPMLGMCLMPVAALCAVLGLITGIASVIRTTLKPELDGRLQALAGIGFSLLWGAAAWLMVAFVARNH